MKGVQLFTVAAGMEDTEFVMDSEKPAKIGQQKKPRNYHCLASIVAVEDLQTGNVTITYILKFVVHAHISHNYSIQAFVSYST